MDALDVRRIVKSLAKFPSCSTASLTSPDWRISGNQIAPTCESRSAEVAEEEAVRQKTLNKVARESGPCFIRERGLLGKPYGVQCLERMKLMNAHCRRRSRREDKEERSTTFGQLSEIFSTTGPSLRLLQVLLRRSSQTTEETARHCGQGREQKSTKHPRLLLKSPR